ncbi:hypothetical protein MKX01_007265 [Papaver californicum]|nr:hypothetical protein MKX01_007265 [Papaver californicum]
MPRNKTGHSESIQVILCDFSNAEDLTKTEVSGGNVKLNGTLTVELERPGGETVIGDIIRMLDEEQGCWKLHIWSDGTLSCYIYVLEPPRNDDPCLQTRYWEEYLDFQYAGKIFLRFPICWEVDNVIFLYHFIGLERLQLLHITSL